MQPANPFDRIALALQEPPADRVHAPRRRRSAAAWVVALLGLSVSILLGIEARTSWLQSRIAVRIGDELTWSVQPGPSRHIAFPRHGPYDIRLGYAGLSRLTRRLRERGFEVSAQSRMSAALLVLEQLGVAPPYREKSTAGLRLLDRRGKRLFDARHPHFTWDHFDQIPPVIIGTLLFIENRELLRATSAYANPAVEWDRLLRALTWRALPVEGRTPGASTLATQLEKYRHSPGGRTGSASEKLRQMTAATLRAYRSGLETEHERRRIVLDYLNTVPLAARPGQGEVTGLGDGLAAWYGVDPQEITRLLADPDTDPTQRGRAYAEVLSLLLAQRRPAHYLLRDREALGDLVRTYLPLLYREGVIGAKLRDHALAWQFPVALPPASPITEPSSKATTALRASLVELLGVRDVYELDRLDLEAELTLDARAQHEVEALLAELRDPERVSALGLRGERLLGESHTEEVVYSVLVFERTRAGNALRVQADSLARPFNVNEGMKLDLGSTAKLRTLVHYQQIVAALHARYRDLPPAELRRLEIHPRDAIGRWAADQMSARPGISVDELLAAALERRYSASPAESFFTGGGLHRFANFDPEDDTRRVSLREAFTRSINLPFVRLMRDIVRHVLYGAGGPATALSDDPGGWKRRAYLERFADTDARARLEQFRARHLPLAHEQRVASVRERVRPLPARLAAFHAWVAPDAPAEALQRFLDEQLPGHGMDIGRIRRLHARYASNALSPVDRARVMRIDPLELWLIEFLRERPDASTAEQWASSADVRDADRAWLFRTRNGRARERRLATMLERDAFTQIHRSWQQLGYPFAALVPSLATAIGASADRPAALAELVGIIVADGVRAPALRVEQLHFGADTPYETHLQRPARPGQRVLDPAVAHALRQSLLDVVAQGTARRAQGLLGSSPEALAVGGKTGTGDRRTKRFAADGRLKSAEATSRSAVFVFALGDRFFGVVTAYVEGAAAAHHGFTSGLPVRILALLEPVLMDLSREPAFLPDSTQARSSPAQDDAQAGLHEKTHRRATLPQATLQYHRRSGA